MISFNDQILNDEGKYCIQIETDNRDDYNLILYLLRGLIDNKDCSVTVTNKLSKDVVYLNREAIG